MKNIQKMLGGIFGVVNKKWESYDYDWQKSCKRLYTN